MKRILVLGQNDTKNQGHALSVYNNLRLKTDAHFLCYVANNNGDGVISYYSANGSALSKLKYLYYRINSKRYFLKNKKNKMDDTDEYCFFNSSHYFPTNAKQILAKSCHNPDVIIICWHDYFISPKTIYDLYQLTKAKMVILMCDPYIATGGCHYPNDCKRYQVDCKSCPALKNGKVAELLFEEKIKYLKDIPLTLVGTSYDLRRTEVSPFLSNKERIRWSSIPSIPVVNKTKIEARKELGISEKDFVIIAGSASLKDKRKGFQYLYDSLKLFNGHIRSEREVTFLLLGNEQGELFNFGDNIKVVRPGFLNTKGLVSAFYASDLFCSTSVDDTGPYMVSYSVACGVPVVSFPVGIAIDLVLHLKTGFLADYKSCESIKDGILAFYNMRDDEYKECSRNCLTLINKFNNEKSWEDQILDSLK